MRAAFVYIVRTSLVKVVDIVGLRRPVLCAGAVHACVVALASPMLALRVPPVHALSVHACVVRALALPMLALRAPAVRALAVRARAVRLRAGRVVCWCSARLHRADFVRRRRRVDVDSTTSTPKDSSPRPGRPGGPEPRAALTLN